MSRPVQQINLYQPMFRKREEPFTALTLFRIVATLLITMGAITLALLWQAQKLERLHDELEAQKEVVAQRLLEIKQRMPQRQANPLLEKRLESLMRHRDAQRLVNTLLEQQLGEAQQPLSAFFEGLAKSPVEGLWFNTIRVSEGGDYLALQGRVLEPELVPRLLSSLGKEEVFKGRAFQVLKLNRQEEDQRIDFQLMTRKREEDDGPS
ncbi:MAG TPA: hypothetical protein EYH03_00990 [Chromatiales bacterium]|nr:hypothetical protein [Chromatiales bacterium]